MDYKDVRLEQRVRVGCSRADDGGYSSIAGTNGIITSIRNTLVASVYSDNGNSREVYISDLTPLSGAAAASTTPAPVSAEKGEVASLKLKVLPKKFEIDRQTLQTTPDGQEQIMIEGRAIGLKDKNGKVAAAYTKFVYVGCLNSGMTYV
jgi:hypothetical protein